MNGIKYLVALAIFCVLVAPALSQADWGMGKDDKKECGWEKPCGCEKPMWGMDEKKKCMDKDDKKECGCEKPCGCEKSMIGRDEKQMSQKNMKSMMEHNGNVGVKLVVVNLIVE